FGYDFGMVRIHADRGSAVSASAVHARAYTVGRDIVFNEGEYAPASAEGKRLLAHELVHVVQQGFHGGLLSSPSGSGSGSRPLVVTAGNAARQQMGDRSAQNDNGGAPAMQATLSINEPGDRFEQEADRIASLVLQGRGPEGDTTIAAHAAPGDS